MKYSSSSLLALFVLSGVLLHAQNIISTFYVTSVSGLGIDTQGTVYVTDSSTGHVRKISGGTLSVIAGNGTFGYTGDGGPALNASLFMSSGTSGVAVDGSNNVYFSDGYNNVVRKITPAGIISTYAGKGTGHGTGFGAFSGDGGQATAAEFDGPGDLAFDANGNLYICDIFNSRVRKVTPGGIITTVAGNGNVSFSGDGGQATSAAVRSPAGIAVDAQGNLFISEGDARVRKVAPNGIITTYAGIDGNASSPLGDGGPATSAYIDGVGDLVVDSAGNVYVDGFGGIRKITASGAGFLSNPTSLSFSATTGGPAPAAQSLNITSSGAALGFTAAASSTGNWLSVTPTTGTTPATLSASVNASALGAGTYTGTITLTPVVAGNSPLAITVTLTVTGASNPIINTGAIYNATGYQAKLAPDTVFVIFGSNLGPASFLQATGPAFPDNLAGTSITFTPIAGGNPIQAKMIYTLAGQIAGLLPSSIPLGTYAVRVTYNGLTSAPQNTTVVARSFGIATVNSGGTGLAQANIFNVNGGISLTRFTAGSVNFADHTWILGPAHPGDTITLWGTGGGADPANDTGGTSGDQTAAGNFRVTAGTRTITPLYAGAAFGYPGLWQINFTLPPDITVDCFTTVSVTAGGELSNSVIIPVAAAGQTSCTDPTMPAALLSKLDAGGNITLGAFALAKITAPATGTQEGSTGGVLRYTATQWQIQNSGPVIGACRVYDRTYPQNGSDPANPSAFLDAGSLIGIAGPGVLAGAGMGAVSAPLGIVYSGTASAGTYRAGTYTITGTGGSQVGALTSSTVFPASFTATNWDSITLVDRTKPLTFNWTATGVANVAILVSTAVNSGGNVHISTITCNVPPGGGTYSIPVAALAYLSPAGVTGSAFGAMSITGQSAPGTFTATITGGGQIDLSSFIGTVGIEKNIAVQ